MWKSVLDKLGYVRQIKKGMLGITWRFMCCTGNNDSVRYSLVGMWVVVLLCLLAISCATERPLSTSNTTVKAVSKANNEKVPRYKALKKKPLVASNTNRVGSKEKLSKDFIGQLLTALKQVEEARGTSQAKSGGGQEALGSEAAQQDDTIIFPRLDESKLDQRGKREPIKGSKLITVDIDFDQADFSEVAKIFLGEIVKVNYVISPGVKAKVSIRFKGSETRQGYLEIFRSLCDIYDLSLVMDEGLFKIFPRKDMYKRTVPVYVGGRGSLDGKKWVTQIIPLRYVDAQKVVAFLKHFVRPGALVVAPQNVQAVIIVDTAESVERYLKLVKTLDIPFFNGKGIKFYDIKYLNVKTVASELEKVVFALGGGIRGKNAALTFIPIQEANKLLVVTNTPEIFPQVDIMVRNIDQIGPRGKRRTFFRRLRNVEAVDVARVLERLYKQKISDTKRPDHIDIIADKATNSLTIRAFPEDYANMTAIIDQMDAQPLQVLIKVLVAEVRLTKDYQFGIEWWMHQNMAGGALEVSNFPNLSLVTGNMFNAYFINSGSVYSLLKMVSSKTKVEVLAAPHLIVRNGKTAKINIGNQVPLLKAEIKSTEGLQTQETIAYQDTGIRLEITPTISSDGFVTLDIVEKSSAAQYSLSNLPKSPVITNRNASTSLTIQDGKTVLLAGMIRKEDTNQQQDVPGLSKIPLIGRLFRMKARSGSKTELLITITAHIIRQPGEAALLTQQFERALKALRSNIL